MGDSYVLVAKPRLSVFQIVNMNVGFFGLQYAFGLQSANMTPIYSFLGAEPSQIPLLWLAGPVTGLVVQPLVGALSDKTVSRLGRRTPYFLIGAIMASVCLFIMPFSAALWMAASVLWILDVGANTTMEPYRAFVSDKLDTSQHNLGYLVQSAFSGLGAFLAFLTPTLLILFGIHKSAVGANGIPVTTFLAFFIGAIVMIGSILWTVRTTKEIPLSAEERANILSSPRGLKAAFVDLKEAISAMPRPMRQMGPMMLLSWYANFVYLQYMPLCLATSVFPDAESFEAGLVDASLLWGRMAAFYFLVAFVAGFALVPFANKLGPKRIHGFCTACGGIGIFLVPLIGDTTLLFVPMLGIGLYWASTMGITYVMLASFLPKEKTGIYMGIFNMFIVVPMIIQTLSVPLYFDTWLGGSAPNAIHLAGILLILAAASVGFIDLRKREENDAIEAATAASTGYVAGAPRRDA